MIVAAFLGRENPDFVYPEILWAFLAMLAANLLLISMFPRGLPEQSRLKASVISNLLLVAPIVHYSGDERSYFWVMYLLPVFHACLYFGQKDIIATTVASLILLSLSHAELLRITGWPGLLTLLVKAATIVFAALAVMRTALSEREASAKLDLEQRRMEEERLRTRGQVQHMDRLATLGTLTASIAHELKSPMMTMRGYSELAEEGRLTTDEAEKALEGIGKAVQRCDNIIKKMLTFSRRQVYQREPCDINALIHECVDLKSFDWTFTGPEVEEIYDAKIPNIPLSGPEFQQVIFNLLNNAQQALQSAGVKAAKIVVSTQRRPDRALVSVADNGPGIPAENAKKIWEPFFTTKDEGEGTGLGLAICRQIIEAQGGRIFLDQDHPAGAVFVIEFPTVKPETAA